MALIKCTECNNQISDKADKCPHCGYVLKMNNGLGCLNWGVIIIVIFFIIIYFIGSNSGGDNVIDDYKTYTEAWREPIGVEFLELGKIISQNNIRVCGEYYVKEIEEGEYVIACTDDGTNWNYFVIYKNLNSIYRANDEMISKLTPPRF